MNENTKIDIIPAATLLLAGGFIFLGYRQTYLLSNQLGWKAWLMDAGILPFLTFFCAASFALVNINRWATLLCLIGAAACLLVLGGDA